MLAIEFASHGTLGLQTVYFARFHFSGFGKGFVPEFAKHYGTFATALTINNDGDVSSNWPYVLAWIRTPNKYQQGATAV